MKLIVNIEMKSEFPTSFTAEFCGQKQIIDKDSLCAEFAVDKPGKYIFMLSQQRIDEKFSWVQKILYLLFMPIIGIFAMFSTFEEAVPLHKKVNPYLINQKFTLDVERDMTIHILYEHPIYEKQQKRWSNPRLFLLNSEPDHHPEIIKYFEGFNNAYLDFKRMFTALYFDVLLVFVVFAISAFHKGATTVFFAFLLLSIAVVLACLLTLLGIKKYLERMSHQFKQEKQTR